MDGLDNLEGLSSLGDSDPLRTEGLPVSLRGCCSLGMPLLVLCHSTAQGWLIGEERKRTPILQMVALLFWKLRVTGGARNTQQRECCFSAGKKYFCRQKW